MLILLTELTFVGRRSMATKNNVVLNKDGTRKCVISVNYDVWAKDNSQADTINDICIYGAPPIPDELMLPKWTGVWDDVAKEWKNGGWVEGDPVTADLAKQQANIAAIKAKAGEIITSRYPLWKQAQMKDRQMKLTAIMIGARVNSQGKLLPSQKLAAAEEDELVSLQDACDWIYSVKEVSDIAEQNNTPVGDIVWPV